MSSLAHEVISERPAGLPPCRLFGRLGLMVGEWQRVGSRAWWAMATAFFLGLELMLRIKLGSICCLVMGYTLAWLWLAERQGDPLPESGRGTWILLAGFVGLVICIVIFLVFAGLNIGLRTFNNNWQWFQLP